MVNVEAATIVLTLGSALVPDRFPQLSEETVKAWAMALDKSWPADLWREATLEWSRTCGLRMCSPGDILAAGRVVRERWESDPVRRRVLQARRLAARDERDRRLAEAFPELAGPS